MGGAHPLTSKIAVVGPSTHPAADVDYLFLQAVVDEARIDDGQNCGNLLAGVGPFALEEGLFPATGDVSRVRINMLNTGSLAVAAINSGRPGALRRARSTSAGDRRAVYRLLDVAGSSCSACCRPGTRHRRRDRAYRHRQRHARGGTRGGLGLTGTEPPGAGGRRRAGGSRSIRLQIGPG
jgi:hypothetical protein